MGEGNRYDWPAWVRVGLWGVPNWTAAWAFVWLCVSIAVGYVAYGSFADRRFLAGGILLLSALWYCLSIRWVYRHGRWDKSL
jgi:hypothetical protein